MMQKSICRLWQQQERSMENEWLANWLLNRSTMACCFRFRPGWGRLFTMDHDHELSSIHQHIAELQKKNNALDFSFLPLF